MKKYFKEHENFSDYVNELIDDGFEVEVSKKDGILTFEVEKDDFEVTVIEPEDGVYQIEDSNEEFETLKDAVMSAMSAAEEDSDDDENDDEDLDESFKIGDKVSFVDPDAKRRIHGKLVKKSDLMGIDFADVEIAASGGSKNVIKIPMSLLESLNESYYAVMHKGQEFAAFDTEKEAKAHMEKYARKGDASSYKVIKVNESLEESNSKEVVLGTFKKAKSLSVVYDGKNKRVIIKSSAGDKPVVLMRGADNLKGNLPAMVRQLQHTHKDKFEKAGDIDWKISNESREFVAKAAYAAKDGKKNFKLGDKEFPVTINKNVASKITEAINEAFENSIEKIIEESVEMSMTQKQVLDLGRKMQAMAAKEKDDRISIAMANLGDHLEDFGAAFGPKNMKDLAKKTGMSEQIIKMLIQRVQKAG